MVSRKFWLDDIALPKGNTRCHSLSGSSCHRVHITSTLAHWAFRRGSQNYRLVAGARRHERFNRFSLQFCVPDDEYTKLLGGIVARRKGLVREKVASEYPHLRALPAAPVPEYVKYRARVRKWSTIRVDSRTYSVPSQLKGVMVDVRLHTDHVEVYYKGHLAESMERLRGKGTALIDYRHIIGSLVRKPGAFAHYRFREQMYPTHTFRLAYDAMVGWKGERADVDYCDDTLRCRSSAKMSVASLRWYQIAAVRPA